MIHVEVRGVRDLQAKLSMSRLVTDPFRRFLVAALFVVEGFVKPLVPRDTGYLGRSIQSKVKGHTGTVETNAPHALFVHGRPPNPPARSRPHWPPVAEITPWARRKGLDPYVVARAIARKGTKLVPFMTRGAKQAVPAVRAMVRSLARDVERKAS